MRQRRHGFVKTLLSLVFVALLVEAGFCGWSAWQIKDKGEAVYAAYGAYETQMENDDFEGALASLRTVATNVQDINRELKGWQWQVASKIPVFGEDVVCCQEASQITDDLVSQALLPVLQRAEDLFGDASSSDFVDAIGEKATQASELLSAIENARTVVSTCRDKAQALPTSHFDELNKLVAQLRQATDEADKSFDEFSGLIDLAGSVRDLANSLV